MARLTIHMTGRRIYDFVQGDKTWIKEIYLNFVRAQGGKSGPRAWWFLLKCILCYRLMRMPGPILEINSTTAEDWDDALIALLLGCHEAGGSAFEFFLDRGITSISIYGNSQVVSSLSECAQYSSIHIDNWMSKQPKQMIAYLPTEHPVDLTTPDKVSQKNRKQPVLLAQESTTPDEIKSLRNLTDEVIGLYVALSYSLEKNALHAKLQQLRLLTQSVPIVVVNLPQLSLVGDKTILEQYVLWNTEAGAYNSPDTWHQNVIDEVFRSHGLSDDYIQEAVLFFKMFTNGSNVRCKDRRGKYVNCAGGCRVTTGLPANPKGTVYFFGNSVVMGVGAGDSHTIPSQLQALINGSGAGYQVQNYGNSAGKDYPAIVSRIRECPLREGDIVVVGVHSHPAYFEWLYRDFITIDLQPYFDRPHDMGEVFYDAVHMNFVGYGKIAQVLFDKLSEEGLLEEGRQWRAEEPRPITAEATHKEKPAATPLGPDQAKELEEYLEELHKLRRPEARRVGSVVMNCNPFTLGHRYLVEQAAARVDHLFLFVVEEDRSLFPFRDRLRLVREGTADMGNVTVLPSGRFVISALTFALYFQKEERQEELVDSTADVRIFGEHIAPALGIGVRFLGEEPLDAVTRQYNATLQSLLPTYGVEVKVIPRREQDGEPISASRVRKLLEEKDFVGIARLVPETTLRYLEETYG